MAVVDREMIFISEANAGDTKQGRKNESGRQLKLEPSDAELLSSLTLGDGAETFWCLWSRHQETLRKTCLREMDGNVADAEDALSHVMLKTQNSLPKYAPEIKHLRAWLVQMTRNLCIDLRRKHRHRSETAENWKIITQTEPKTEPPMQQAEGEWEIRQQIAALPQNLREAFEFHIVREIPVKKVAILLGLSPANVRKRVQLARTRLRRHRESSLGLADPSSGLRVTTEKAPASLVEVEEISSSVVQTVRVKLSCGAEELFHVFSGKPQFAPGRKIKWLQGRLSRQPEHFENRLELGDLFYRKGEWRAAVGEWQRALEVRPELSAALKLGQTLIKLGMFDDAVAVFKRIRREKLPSMATARHIDGWIAYGESNAGRSAAEFRAGADLEPGNASHWHGLALAERMVGRTPEALKAIERVLKLNPKDLVALSLGHEMLMATGDIKEAFRRVQQFLGLVPNDLLALRRLVDCRCRLKLTQGTAGVETRQLLRRGARLSRNSLLMRQTLAAFFLSQHELKKALAVHREFTEQHPQCMAGRQNYLSLLAGTGQKSPTAKHHHASCPCHEKAAPFCA